MEKKKTGTKRYLIDAFVKKYLRRASIFWPGKTDAMKSAKVAPGKYKCDACEQVFGMIKIEGKDKKGNKKTRYRNPLEADHKESVIPIDGSIVLPNGKTDWNVYIERLFIPPDRYSKLCRNCHDSKTKLEDSMRGFYKAENKTKLGQELIDSLKETLDSERKNRKKKNGQD